MDASSDQGPPRGRTWTWLLISALVLFALWSGMLGGTVPRQPSYAEFKQHLANGEVHRVVIGEDFVSGVFRLPPDDAGDAEDAEDAEDASEAEPADVPFRTTRLDDPGLIEELDQAGVDYTGQRPDPLFKFLLAWIVPLALILILFRWLARSSGRAGKQAMGFGKSTAKLVPETGTGVSFDDVAGCVEAKTDLREMVEFLRNPQRFTALGARIPRGVLLLGPPGTGKTLLARAVAGEAEVPFFSISGSDFVEMFVGVGAARVRDLFVQAKTKAPCIVFIDEIDAVGRQRGVSMGVVNDEREQTLNQLLSEMDGFEVNSGVILLAATNRPEVLDRALLRPGRFDRQVVLDAPDLAGREAILRVHARGKPISDDVDLARVARATPGMSGADLANALNEAALAAAQNARADITQEDIEEAVERVVAGPERRSRRLGEAEKRRVAYHESGHALVAAYSEHSDPVQKISIVPRGRAALGYTLTLPEQEQFLETAPGLSDRLDVLLGGRAAEELVLGEPSTGAQDDLQTATAVARQMVCLFGMSERIGPVHCAHPTEGAFLRGDGGLRRDCSEETAREIDEEVRGLLQAALDRARSILGEHRAELDAIAAKLLETETLDAQAFADLLADPPSTVVRDLSTAQPTHATCTRLPSSS